LQWSRCLQSSPDDDDGHQQSPCHRGELQQVEHRQIFMMPMNDDDEGDDDDNDIMMAMIDTRTFPLSGPVSARRTSTGSHDDEIDNDVLITMMIMVIMMMPIILIMMMIIVITIMVLIVMLMMIMMMLIMMTIMTKSERNSLYVIGARLSIYRNLKPSLT
jgi:ABC-type multidrug transport system fused ATPase/permease subunit